MVVVVTLMISNVECRLKAKNSNFRKIVEAGSRIDYRVADTPAERGAERARRRRARRGVAAAAARSALPISTLHGRRSMCATSRRLPAPATLAPERQTERNH